MATKPGRVASYLDLPPPIKLLNPLITWSCKIMQKPKLLYLQPFTTTMLMATKLGRTVTYLDVLSSIKLLDV